MPILRLTVYAGSILFSLALIPQVDAGDPNEIVSEESAFFETHIRPLLVTHCYECHSTDSGESEGELRLDSAPAMQRGGTRGSVLVAGKPNASHLIRAVRYEDADMQMPPDGKLSDQDIQLLEAWVQRGAPDTRTVDISEPSAKPASPMERDIQSHWAFVPPNSINRATWSSLRVHDHEVEQTRNQDSIDEVATRLATAKGLTSAGPADAHTLHRRIKHDLHGLPSSWQEHQAVEIDKRPDATRRRVDKMLADPMYGERFARHWLDVARYADTRGYATAGKNRELIGSHRYRDWTINAFSTDMPYDEMIRHQLAGDRTDPDNATGNADAMGFLTVGRYFLSHHDTIDDRIDVIGRGLMGLTLACARCHDHKFDPIPTVDYYSLYNILDNSVPPSDLESAASPLLLQDRGKLKETRVFVRGNPGNRGELAKRQYLTAFRSPDEEAFPTGSGRLDLAQRIASPNNPLTGRVMVNRVWGHLMGRGLVDSASDFGFQTNSPELQLVLDELASDFQTHWSVQRLVRRMINTRIYQQSSAVSGKSQQLDPDNRLWTHAQRKRRDFESMRDGLLVGCGFLDTQMGGPSVEITEPRLTPRRSLYARINRQNLPGLFRTFDFASPDMHSPGRYYTTVPQQSLFLLNHPQMIDASQRASRRTIHSDPSPSKRTRVERLFQFILGRTPTTGELNDSMAFIAKPAEKSSLAFDSRDLWKYGTGQWHEDQLESFTPFATFGKNQWQAEEEFPSKGPLSYASLSKEAGHSASGNVAVIRRWLSPVDGVVKVSGMVGHRSKKGDGIVAVIQVGGKTVFSAKQKSNNRPLPSLKSKIKAGQSVDLIVLCGNDTSYDSFFWRSKLSLLGRQGERIEADSVNDFSGPFDRQNIQSLDRFAQLAQVLFLSNEYAFVD